MKVWGAFEFPFLWRDRWDIIGYVWPPEPDPRECTGQGHCHGCLKWCAWCGDVSDVCDVEWPHCCDTHERYPERPKPPEPDPRQLYLPGVSREAW